jgi:hypothetical protein
MEFIPASPAYRPAGLLSALPFFLAPFLGRNDLPLYYITIMDGDT